MQAILYVERTIGQQGSIFEGKGLMAVVNEMAER